MNKMKYSQSQDLKLREMKDLRQAYVSILCSGLTQAEIDLLDAGQSNASIEKFTRTASKIFLMTTSWMLVHFAEACGETNDMAELGKKLVQRQLEAQQQHRDLLRELNESVVTQPARH